MAHVPQEGDFDLQDRITNCLIKPKTINNKYSWLKAQHNSYPYRKIQTSKQKNISAVQYMRYDQFVQLLYRL
jgi:5'(3')-deoxyribonucleotidase